MMSIWSAAIYMNRRFFQRSKTAFRKSTAAGPGRESALECDGLPSLFNAGGSERDVAPWLAVLESGSKLPHSKGRSQTTLPSPILLYSAGWERGRG
jgi:hypothetical protein